MTDFFTTVSNAALQDNLVLIQLLGVSALLTGSGRFRPALELAQLLFLVMLCACTINMVINFVLLVPLGLETLQLPVFAIVGASVASIAHRLLQGYLPTVARRHDLALLFFGGSTAVVGTSLLAPSVAGQFGLAIAFSLGSAMGFCLLLVMIAALREQLEGTNLPAPFRGVPVTLISAGIVSLCLYVLQAV